MHSNRSLVPFGGVATAPACIGARATELRQMKESLLQGKASGDGSEQQVQAELKLFDKPDALSNMILVVEDTELHVHKEILARWSPVFMAMFTNSFAESESGRVNMFGKLLDDVRLLLNCLYPPNTHTVTADNVMVLLPLIEEYDVGALKKKSEDILLAQEPSLDILLIAHEYNMPRVLENTITACACLSLSSIDHRTHQEITNYIPPEYIMDIYREKIELQITKLKSYKKLEERLASLSQKLQQWGKARNSYPCDKHRIIDENCVNCLKRFRALAFEQIKSLADGQL